MHRVLPLPGRLPRASATTPENKTQFAGPRFLMRIAELEMHPLDVSDRLRAGADQGGRRASATSPSAAPRSAPEHIHITDNAIIPLKERVVTESYDPIVWLARKLTGKSSAPVKIHEYQGKAILREFGVPVPSGDVADTPAQARAIAERSAARWWSRPRCTRAAAARAGGVKLADDPAGAEAAAKQILGMMLKTPADPARGHQGPQGAGGGGLAHRRPSFTSRSRWTAPAARTR